MKAQHIDQLVNTIATQSNQPQATFQALESMVESIVGIKLFTVMEINHQRGVVWRSYSNMPEAYPVSGEKPLQQNAWSELVETQQQTFVANTIDEIAAVFPDHELIKTLGCESCINVPIAIAGRVRGTLNCLHVAGHYTPQRVAAAHALKAPGMLAFLAAGYHTQAEITHV